MSTHIGILSVVFSVLFAGTILSAEDVAGQTLFNQMGRTHDAVNRSAQAVGKKKAEKTGKSTPSDSAEMRLELQHPNAHAVVAITSAIPGITGVNPASFSKGDTVTITGTDFIGVTQVTFDAVSGTILDTTSTSVTAIVLGPVTNRVVTVSSAAGTAVYTSSGSIGAGADLTIPDLGSGFTVIPTPTFNYTGTYSSGKFGFTSHAWANSLGTDSNRQKVGSNLLVPAISVFGIKGEVNWMFVSNPGVKLGLDAEINLLVKKVSYFDSLAKTPSTITNFNPLVVHPRLGLVSSLANNLFFINSYLNVLNVLNENAAFTQFFKTGSKSTFVYPEFDAGVIVGVGNGGKQQIKFEFDLIVNNGDVQQLTLSTDKVIPYVKVGFVTNL